MDKPQTSLRGKELQVSAAAARFLDSSGDIEQIQDTLWDMLKLSVGNETYPSKPSDNYNRMQLSADMITFFRELDEISKSK